MFAKITFTACLALIIAALTITSGCKKESSSSQIDQELSLEKTSLIKYASVAGAYDDSLITCVDAQGNISCMNAYMNDSLFHMNDSLFQSHYLKYCKEMMDGDNMMGGNMMGNSTEHGYSMMHDHSYHGDTTDVNQMYRAMMGIEAVHYKHHPRR